MKRFATAHIRLPDDLDLPRLFGSYDQHLKVIERMLGVSVRARGRDLQVKGPASLLETARTVIDELGHRLRAQGRLGVQDVVLAVQQQAQRQEQTAPPPVRGKAPDRRASGPAQGSSEGPVIPTKKLLLTPKSEAQRAYIEAPRKHDIVIGIGPAGTGKCIAASSLVLTTQGLMPIGTIAADVKPGDYVPIDLEVSTMEGVEKASHFYYGAKSVTKRIRTRLGFEIEATPEHPLLQLSPGGATIWRRADELKVGDFIAIQRGQDLFGQRAEVHFQYRRNGPQDHAKPIHIDQLDEDFAYFMGLMTGDGCLTFKNRVILSSADEQVLACFNRTATRFGLHVFKNGGERPYDRIIASAQLYQLLLYLGMTNGRAHDKRVPRSIFCAPREIVVAFLRGLFDTDGTVSRRDGYPSLSSVSKRLIDEVQIILLNFGILSNKRCKRTKYRGEHRLSYQLEMSGGDADLFFEMIGFRLSRKQELRREGSHNTNVDVIPHLQGLVRSAVATASFPRVVHKSLDDYKRGRRRPSYQKLNEIVEILQASTPPNASRSRLEEIFGQHLFWAEITDIGNGEADVYDLTVPGSHSFCANGFVHHNTFLAMGMAVAALLSRDVSRIILTRPAVEAGERLGFLPGDLYAKVHPFVRPLYDALYDMMDVEQANRLIERGEIEIAPLAYMRGRTLNDSFIILDEAQNATAEQMKMFLTRMGFRSKVIVTGDITQVDLPMERASGLIEIQRILSGVPGIAFVYFTERDVVRHPLLQEIIRAYERHESKRVKGKG